MCPWPIPCTRSMDASNGWSSTTKRFALVGGPALGRSPVPACSWSGTGPFWLILADGARPWMELASRGAVFDVGRRGWWPGARPSGSGVSRTGTCRPLSRVAGMFPCGMRACGENARFLRRVWAWRFRVEASVRPVHRSSRGDAVEIGDLQLLRRPEAVFCPGSTAVRREPVLRSQAGARRPGWAPSPQRAGLSPRIAPPSW